MKLCIWVLCFSGKANTRPENGSLPRVKHPMSSPNLVNSWGKFCSSRVSYLMLVVDAWCSMTHIFTVQLDVANRKGLNMWREYCSLLTKDNSFISSLFYESPWFKSRVMQGYMKLNWFDVNPSSVEIVKIHFILGFVWMALLCSKGSRTSKEWWPAKSGQCAGKTQIFGGTKQQCQSEDKEEEEACKPWRHQPPVVSRRFCYQLSGIRVHVSTWIFGNVWTSAVPNPQPKAVKWALVMGFGRASLLNGLCLELFYWCMQPFLATCFPTLPGDTMGWSLRPKFAIMCSVLSQMR